MTLEELIVIRNTIKWYKFVEEDAETRIWYADTALAILEREIKLKTMDPRISEPIKKEHKWQFYMNGTFCSICGVQIGSNMECK